MTACLRGTERDGLTVWFAATVALAAKFANLLHFVRLTFLCYTVSLGMRWSVWLYAEMPARVFPKTDFALCFRLNKES